MVTRAELQRQTRAVQLQRQIQSRRIEALQRQALTQRTLLEQTRLLEQQQQVEKQISRTPTITERAFEQIIRAAEGKRTAVTKELANEYVRLLEQHPELQEAVNRGQVAGLRARELGFISTAEFLGVSQALTKPKTPTTPVVKPTATEIQLQQSLPPEIRNLPVQDVIAKQNLLLRQQPISTVEIPLTLVQKLRREIKIAQPDLKIGGGEIENIVERAIGFGVGTKNFAVGKFQGEISQLRDITGKRLFTVSQAKGITRLTEEAIINFGVGALTGKGFILIKGAVGRIIPKALANNAKFQKTLGILEVAGGITLSVAAANEVKKAFERGGVNEAIFTTIGFVSFGAGFGKTGLKSNIQAQKEFKQFSNILKKAIPRGRRGSKQVLIQLKKKKKKKKTKKTEKEIELLELELELKAKLERRLLNAKTPKEQVKILLEIWRKLKTPLQKENFRKYLLDLIERDIFKLRKLNGFIPKAKVVKPKTRKKQRQLQKETQKFFTGKAKRRKQIQKQKKKLKQLVKQKAPQAVITAQTIKLISSQRQAQKQLSKQALKVSSLQSQVFKQPQLLKQKQLQKQKLRLITRVSTTLKLTPKQKRAVRRAPKRIKKKLPRLPIIKVPIALPKLTPSQTKLRKAIKKLGKRKAMDVLVGLKVGKRKVIAQGLAPYRAIRKGQKFVDRNIQASYVLRPTGKRPKKKDIAPFQTSFKFRQSKTNPFFQVEKRKHRLDHRMEVLQLKQAKRSKVKFPSGFFPKIKKRRRKKK